jgi:hypothetical protein
MRWWPQTSGLFGAPLVLLACILLFSGCIGFFIADAFATVRGIARDEPGVPYQGCRLELLDARDRAVLDASDVDHAFLWKGERRPGEFIASFVISPYPQSYVLRLSCPESDEAFTSAPTSLSGFPEPFDLGNVQLKRRRRASLPSYGLGSGSPS